MNNMQAKILAEIERRITTQRTASAFLPRLEAVVQYGYSNTGTIYIQRSFHTYATIAFQFNTDYFTATLKGEVVDQLLPKWPDNPPMYRTYPDKREVWFAPEYHESDRVEQFLKMIDQLAMASYRAELIDQLAVASYKAARKGTA